RSGYVGGSAQGSGWRDGPRRFDGGARRNSTRTDSRAAPATLRLHLDVAILRQAPDRYVAKNAFASATEATDNVGRPLLKNQALTSSMNTWPPLSGCLLTEQRLSIGPSRGRLLLYEPRLSTARRARSSHWLP